MDREGTQNNATGLALNKPYAPDSDWRVIITILGWLAIVRGALSLLFPNKMYGIGEAILKAGQAQ